MSSMVTLGVPDDPVFEPAEEGVTKIGGSPHWLCGQPEGLEGARCERCGAILALILSADCPIDDDFDRIIYLFVCPKCGGSARAFRQKRVAAAIDDHREDDSNPLFGPGDLTAPTTVTAGDLLASLASFGQPEPKPAPKKQPKRKQEVGAFPGVYIETFEEPEATLDPSIQYTMSTSVDSTGSGMGMEEDKPDVVVDPVLVEYNEKMSRCPAQVIRYCRFGEPLMQEPIQVRVPPCPKCGAQRCFEVELMPTVIYALAPDSDMDFGPILVYTCSEDCGQNEEEFCFVCPP